ncbi:MAG: hypothetical protein V7707_10835 [Motiliproteus sp.]
MKQQTIQRISDFLIVGVVLVAVSYSAVNSWKNSERLVDLTSDMKGVKESIITLLLDENPNKTELVRKLLTTSALIDGLDKFNSMKYADAFVTWESAAKQGNEDSTFAIFAAREALLQKMIDIQEPEKRREFEVILREAPNVNFADGKYTLKHDKDT